MFQSSKTISGFRDEAKKNIEERNENLPQFIHDAIKDSETVSSLCNSDSDATLVRISNLRIELAAEKEITKELRVKLYNCEKE
jgi:hypothetical protein